jgi:hypothetical protein
VQLHAAVRSPCSGLPLSVDIQQTTICDFPAQSCQPPGIAVVSFPGHRYTDEHSHSALFCASIFTDCQPDRRMDLT